MIAVSDAAAITFSVIGFCVFLALLVVLRILFRREPSWRRFRMGIFIERDPKEDDK